MNSCDIIIIGSGPGGYELAANAVKHNLSTVIIERDQLGGTCLNRGCIPTKALCRSAEVADLVRNASSFGVEVNEFSLSYSKAVNRKDEIVEQLRQGVSMLLNGATVVKGEAKFTGENVVEVNGESYTAPRIVIATGSKPAMLPIPGAELAMTSDDVLSLEQLPESICVIGGGVIGVELASILSSFGVKVTIVEYCSEILPNFDKEIAKRLRTALSRRGIKVVVSASVTAIREGMEVDYESKGKTVTLNVDAVLMAVGRRPVIPEGVVELGVKTGRRGIEVNERYETSIPGIYAIGDVNGECMLAHAATAQGERILGSEVDVTVVPAAVFTVPECSMVGLTEEQCREQGIDYIVSKAMFRANGKALAIGEVDGLVKLIVDKESRKILGCHICGPHAADIVQEIALAISSQLTVDAVANTIHAHPTLGEVVRAAASAI
ncbi:dihydrolipoyl dehydrogenase [uncultured Muribaculum sp.]|uniref:dihydrolipoyl dehydrogenase n=1 Tax=uncultured Muribaculum sp. TaxID=1918613 RepID=UPI0025AFA6C1|nr:dihydrolipoyl dehydrogenase [uncultured Muribaculum sp.]